LLRHKSQRSDVRLWYLPCRAVNTEHSKRFAWVLTGNVLYALSQWALLVVLARLGGASMVGEFAYALALAAPIMLLANLQLRMVAATDASRRHSLPVYFKLRTITSTLALAAIGLAALLLRGPQATAVIVAVGLLKVVEAAGDIIYGHLQRADRLDLVARSISAKAAVLVPAVAGGTALLGSLSAGLVVAVIAWAGLLLLLDLPYSRRTGATRREWLARTPISELRQLVRTTMPLGVALALLSLSANIPRYFLEKHHGMTAVGVHAAISQFVAGLGFLLAAMGESTVPAMARAMTAGDRHGFARATSRLVFAALAAGLGGVVFALVAGRQTLGLLYGPSFATYSRSLLLALATGTIYFLASSLGFALTAARRFREQVFLMIPACAVSAAASWLLVPRLGVDGAILAFGASSAAIAMGEWLYLRRPSVGTNRT
jgi:O-antigen/teichoic acid export membrane protein